MASAFAAQGVGRGDVVAIQLPNWAETAVAYLAFAMLGAVFVPIVHIYGPRETDWILRASGARMLLCPDRWGNLDFLERLERMPAAEKLQVVIVGEEVPPGAVAWDAVARDAAPEFAPLSVAASDPLPFCLFVDSRVSCGSSFLVRRRWPRKALKVREGRQSK